MAADGSKSIRHSLHETVSVDEVETPGQDTTVTTSSKDGEIPSLASLFSAVSVPRLSSLPVKLPAAPSGKEQTFKPITRSMTGDERSGAWVLAGIVGLGFLVGGAAQKKRDPDASSKKKGEESKKDKAHEVAK